jgi:hypothetical protein
MFLGPCAATTGPIRKKLVMPKANGYAKKSKRFRIRSEEGAALLHEDRSLLGYVKKRRNLGLPEPPKPGGCRIQEWVRRG